MLGTEQPVHFGPGAEFAVRLDLTTTEDLDEVSSGSIAPGTSRPGPTEGLEVVDPDGQIVVVHG